MPTLPVIYSDSDLLVVNKPPGLVVAPSDTTSAQTLADILKTDFKIELDRGGIAHRLDKDTSGILLVGKTQKALENLQFQFKERMIKKEYLALVHGLMENDFEVKGDILRHPGNREKFIVKDQLRFEKDQNLAGRESETVFKPNVKYQMSNIKCQMIFEGFNKIQIRKLERQNYGQFTLIKCFPLTGRTHQIRVHLKYINFPIVGDEKYGGRKTVRLDKRWCPRLFLHAHKIEFYHPKSGEKMTFEAPLPEDLEDAMKNLAHE